MPNEFLINSNDTENGYIYKELNSRMARLEGNIEEVFNLLNTLNEAGISVQQLADITKKLNNKADTQYVKNHIEDSVRHLSDVKVMDWDSKYEKPLNGIPESDLEADIRRKLNGMNTLVGGGTGGGESTGNVLKFSTVIGNNSNTSFVVNHALNTEEIYVDIWDTVAKEKVLTNVTMIDSNSIRVTFLNRPSNNQYRIIVVG